MTTLDRMMIFAKTIWAEARGEPLTGQIAVAWVIKNRTLKPSRFGVGYEGVCLKPKQFSCWNADDPQRARLEQVDLDTPSLRRALGVALLVESGDLENPVGEADHYHTVDIRPYWAEEMTVVAIIGRHRFLKE